MSSVAPKSFQYFFCPHSEQTCGTKYMNTLDEQIHTIKIDSQETLVNGQNQMCKYVVSFKEKNNRENWIENRNGIII